MEYKAIINLKTTDIWDIKSRLDEIEEIRDWIEEQVGWNKDKYVIQYKSSGQQLLVWFEEERDAMMCILRWS